jgi:hypothetical protein
MKRVSNLTVGSKSSFIDTTLKVVEQTSKSRFDFDNRISGINLFIAGYF